MQKIKKALKALKDAVTETAEEAVDSAKTAMANEVSSFVDKNKTEKRESNMSQIVVTDKVPFKDAGEIVVLEKGANIAVAAALTTVAIGLEWDETAPGQPEFDGDVSALIVRADKSKNELVYYGSTVGGKIQSKCGHVIHTGDNLTGADDAVAGVAVNEDDETMVVDLTKLDTDIEKVVFFVNIHGAAQKNQNFGSSGAVGARLYDNETAHIFVEADLMEDNATDTSMVVGEFYRKDGAWKYKNLAQGGKLTLQEFANSYKA